MSREKEAFLDLLDDILATAATLRGIVEEGQNSMAFVQESLRLAGLTGALSNTASFIMDGALEEIREAFSLAENDMIKDIMSYLKDNPHER